MIKNLLKSNFLYLRMSWDKLFWIKISKVLLTDQICIVISVSLRYAPSHIIIKLGVIFHLHQQRSRAKARQTLYLLWCHQINYATTLPLIFNQLLVNPPSPPRRRPWPTKTNAASTLIVVQPLSSTIDIRSIHVANLPPSPLPTPRWKMEHPKNNGHPHHVATTIRQSAAKRTSPGGGLFLSEPQTTRCAPREPVRRGRHLQLHRIRYAHFGN